MVARESTLKVIKGVDFTSIIVENVAVTSEVLTGVKEAIVKDGRFSFVKILPLIAVVLAFLVAG
jgi:hypothetical protein